jgi:thiamine kinase-like enzyme
MTNNEINGRIRALPIWNQSIKILPLTGGITNVNFLVEDGADKYVARLGADIIEHQIMRFNELSASRAAHAAGLSPEVIYADKGLTILEYLDSKTFAPEDVRQPNNLNKIVALLRKCHTEIPKHLRGPTLIFWVFHVIRDYGSLLLDADSAHKSMVPDLVAKGNALEALAGPFDIVFGHNDLLAANILDDGKRLWLIDWDYAGFNSPLFDLGGLASNNELDEAQERWMLEAYFEVPPTDALLHKYNAMKCASLLRETMWSMVSEIKSNLDFDYSQYTAEYLARFTAAYEQFRQSGE